jgi:hypothetical protein
MHLDEAATCAFECAYAVDRLCHLLNDVRYQLDAVLTALVNELLVSQPSEPELWMAAQLADFAKSWDSVLPRVPLRHGSTLGETVELAVLHRPFKQQLIVAETGAECEAAARLMLSDLERHQREGLARGRSAVAAVGLDTEWAPPGNETVVCLTLLELANL